MNLRAAGGVFVDKDERSYGVPYRNARCNQLIKVLKNTIDLAGFDLVARIEVRDRETGRTYR